MQPVFVGAIDREQHVDRLDLGARRVRAARTVERRASAPVPLMHLERALAKAFGADASALELEQEPQARPQQVVEVVDGQGAERVGIEGRRGAAAQPRHELLLEQPLPRLVEDAQLARRPDQICELVQKPCANAVKGSDP